MSLSAQIEIFLLSQPYWVSAETICAHFGIKERDLRATGAKPGLITDFAISSDRGFLHVKNATRGEWISFKNRLRKHAVSEFRRVRRLGQSRSHVSRPTAPRPFRVEKDSGQVVFL